MDDKLEQIRAHKLQELKKYVKSDTMPEKNYDAPLNVDDNSFQKVISDNSLVVVDCWAPWCAPCRMQGPVIDQLAKEYAGKIVFAKLNTDENGVTASSLGIMSIPTLLVYKNGELVDRLAGFKAKNMLEQKLKVHL